MAELQARCLRSIGEIPREHWDDLWPPQVEGYDFYRCQEEAGIADFEFFYLGLYADDRPVLLAPLFTAPFNMGLAMSDAWRARLEKLQRRSRRLLVFKTLFCGSPTSERNVVGMAEAYRDDPALFAALRVLAQSLLDAKQAVLGDAALTQLVEVAWRTGGVGELAALVARIPAGRYR